MTEPRNRVNWYRVAVIGTAAIVALVALELIALIDYGNPESTAKTISAVIAVVGVIFTGTVSFIGIEVKRSLDERRLSLDRETEARLRLETAIKAVELFKSATGEGSQAETAGALFALARLGELDFALHLLDHLWPEHKVDTQTATWVINECLENASPRTQEFAAVLLQRHATQLPAADGDMALPLCLCEPGQVDLPENVMAVCTAAFSSALRARPPREWGSATLLLMLGLLYGFIEDLGSNDEQKPSRHALATVALEFGATLNAGLHAGFHIRARGGLKDVGLVMKELEGICKDVPSVVKGALLDQAAALADWREADQAP